MWFSPRILTLVLLLLADGAVVFASPSSQSAATLPPLVDVQQIQVNNPLLDQGINAKAVWAILQDNQGFLWFGGVFGLTRYDGLDAQTYTEDPNDPNSLSYDSVRALSQDSAGFIWVGTDNGGLNRFDPRTEKFTRYMHDPANPNSLSHNFVTSISEDQSGALWVSTYGGLNRFDPATQTFTQYLHDPDKPDSLSNDVVNDVYEDRAGNVWAATSSGLDLLDHQSNAFTHYRHDSSDPGSLSSNAVSTIYEDRSGTLWVGTIDNGLNRFDQSQGNFVQYLSNPNDLSSLSSPNVTAIQEDRAGNLWVGTAGGLNRLERDTGKVVRYPYGSADSNYPNRLADPRVKALYQDREGLLWIAIGGYVNVIDLYRKPFLRYRYDPADTNSLSATQIRGVYMDPPGIVWAGTIGSGLNRFDLHTGQVTRYVNDPDNPNSLGNNAILDIKRDQGGAIWVGTMGGVSKLDPTTGKFVNYRHDPANPNSLVGNTVWSIVEDQTGMFWFATTLGLDEFDPKTETFTHFHHDPKNPGSISGDVLNQAYMDRSGTLWFSTQGDGLNRYDRETETFTHYRHDRNNPNSISDDNIYAIFEDGMGTMWFGGWTGGLNKFTLQTGSFAHYSVKDGLADNTVLCVVNDDQGQLWIATATALSKLDPKTNVITTYTSADGLPAGGNSGESCYRSPSGEMFFGTYDGLVAFYPEAIQNNTFVPPVVISDIQIDHAPVAVGDSSVLGQSIDYSDKLDVPPEANTLSFMFAALSYRAPRNNRYRYMLQGFDTGWTEVDSRSRFATYTNLPPGDYVFRVLGSNNDGVWNEVGSSLAITVQPAWWETIWFRLGLVAIVAGGVFAVYRVRTNMYKARTRELEKQVGQRTSELRTLLNASQNVGSTLELEPLLALILEQLKAVIDYSVASIQTQDGEELVSQSYVEPTSYNDDTLAQLQLSQFHNIARVIDTQKPVYIPDLTKQETRKDEATAARLPVPLDGTLPPQRSWLGMPVVYKGEIIGVLTATHWQADFFSPSAQMLAQTFTNYVAYAIANAQLYEQAKENAAEDERQRIARELHDSLSQTLYAANSTVYSLDKVLDKNPETSKERVTELKELINQAQVEMRSLLLGMLSKPWDEVGVQDLIRQSCQDFEHRWHGTLTAKIETVPRLASDVQQAYYYIAREALNNTAKHANATTITVHLYTKGTEVILEITDNGSGFDPSRTKTGHFGLSIMQDQAHAVGAELQIFSKPESGSKITLSYLLQESASPIRERKYES